MKDDKGENSPTHPGRGASRAGMSTSSRDETAEPEPSDRDLTEDGTGRLGLAFNNPYLQRVYVDSMFS